MACANNSEILPENFTFDMAVVSDDDDEPEEDPHQSRPSYNYRKERFLQQHRSFEYDPAKGAQGSAFPFKTNSGKWLPHTNQQVYLSDHSRLIVNGYQNNPDPRPRLDDSDYTLGFFFDDLVGLLHLMNNTSKRNPGNTEFDKESLDHITTLLNAILLVRDGMVLQPGKHQYAGSPIERDSPPFETASQLADEIEYTAVRVFDNYVQPLMVRLAAQDTAPSYRKGDPFTEADQERIAAEAKKQVDENRKKAEERRRDEEAIAKAEAHMKSREGQPLDVKDVLIGCMAINLKNKLAGIEPGPMPRPDYDSYGSEGEDQCFGSDQD